MAVWRATAGVEEGFAAFDTWSQELESDDAADTRERWLRYLKYPPTGIGAGTIFWLANYYSPRWRDSLPSHLKLFWSPPTPPR